MSPIDDLAAWDAADRATKVDLAVRSSEAVGLDFAIVRTFEQADQRHDIAVAHLDDTEWVLIPGGRAQLGFRPGSFRATGAQLESYAETEREYGLPGLDEYLVESLAEARTVRIDPFWLEVDANPLGREPLGVDDIADAVARPGGVTVTTAIERYRELPVAPVDAGPGPDDPWRLPTADEWEWACRAGTASLFRWGDDCPVDCYPVDQCAFSAHRETNAFGLAIAIDPYDSELTAALDVAVGGDGGAMICGGAGYFVGWLPLASAWRLPLDDPTEPVFGLHRRRCIPCAH